MEHVEHHTDLRRRAAFLSQGVGRFLVIIQMATGSMDGAIAGEQWGVAAMQARLVLWECMAIRSIPRGGEITWPRESVSFDPFRLATPEELAVVGDLLQATARVAAGVDTGEVPAWRAAIMGFAEETEALLEVPGGIPQLRSADEMFRAFRMAQGVFEILDSLSLPSPLPAQWADPDSAQAAT